MADFPILKKTRERSPDAKRWNHEAGGMILKLDNGIVVVPYRYDGDLGWICVVAGGTDGSNHRGGYDLAIPAREIEAAERIELNL